MFHDGNLSVLTTEPRPRSTIHKKAAELKNPRQLASMHQHNWNEIMDAGQTNHDKIHDWNEMDAGQTNRHVTQLQLVLTS